VHPEGSGGAGASAALALLDDRSVSPASRRLASASTALGTRPIVLSPRAAKERAMEQTEVHGHIIPFRTLAKVWVALILLTAILVITSRLFHQALSVWAMLIVTPIKAGLVFFFFMHLKYEGTFLKSLVFMTLGLLTMVIGLLFFDILYR
jgi:cytochrome c oxidase subunit 4